METDFQTIEVFGKQHVVVAKERAEYTYVYGKKTERVEIPQANYRNTGMALCGVLKKGQTLEQFIKKFNEKKAKLNGK